jgi:hypothetical protein
MRLSMPNDVFPLCNSPRWSSTASPGVVTCVFQVGAGGVDRSELGNVTGGIEDVLAVAQEVVRVDDPTKVKQWEVVVEPGAGDFVGVGAAPRLCADDLVVEVECFVPAL